MKSQANKSHPKEQGRGEQGGAFASPGIRLHSPWVVVVVG